MPLFLFQDYFSATEVFEQLLEIEESVDSHSALLNGIGRIHLQVNTNLMLAQCS